jgi:signal peptidase I
MTGKSRISRIVQWSLLGVVIVLLIIKVVFIGYYQVPQNGMYPGLPAGSRLFVSKRTYSGPSDVQRGDVVVFVSNEGGKSYVYIWRVIGLPGDTILTSGESLIINGQTVARERAREEPGAIVYREQAGDVEFEIAFSRSPEHPPPEASMTVPAEHFFVMGDNRFDAVDSRYLGPIAFSAIIGRKL